MTGFQAWQDALGGHLAGQVAAGERLDRPPPWATLCEPLRSRAGEITGFAFGCELGTRDAERRDTRGVGFLGDIGKTCASREPHVADCVASYVAARRRFPMADLFGIPTVLAFRYADELDACAFSPAAVVTLHSNCPPWAAWLGELWSWRVRAIRCELVWERGQHA